MLPKTGWKKDSLFSKGALQTGYSHVGTEIRLLSLILQKLIQNNSNSSM
jgi:hypothetical protein